MHFQKEIIWLRYHKQRSEILLTRNCPNIEQRDELVVGHGIVTTVESDHALKIVDYLFPSFV